VFTDSGLDRRFYELCALAELKNALRSGDIWVQGSRQFKDFDEYLIPNERFSALREANRLSLAVATDCEAYVKNRLCRLEQQLETVDRIAQSGELPDVIITVSRLKITSLASTVPEEADQLIRKAYALLPGVKITELLLEVDDLTGFTRHSTHLKSQEVSKDRILLLTAILADAINLGLTKMAETCRGATYARLTWLQAWHIRDETYSAALAQVVNAQFRHPFAAFWGDGTTSSSDGQYFRAGDRGEAAGQINSTTAVILECSFIRMFPTSTRRFTLR
jgi:Tn3 transposase DDE domain